MTGDELDRLRALAYGPDGGRLDAVQLRRLEELEAARRTGAGGDAPSPGAETVAAPSPGAATPAEQRPRVGGRRDPARFDDLFEGIAAAPSRVAPEAVPADAAGWAAESASRAWPWVVVVVAALLVPVAALVGFRLGVSSAPVVPDPEPVVFGGGATDPAAGLERVQDGLFDAVQAGGGWDGEVRLLGRYESALVWWGTTGDGARTCIVLDAQARATAQCDDTDLAREIGLVVGFDLMDVVPLGPDGGTGTALECADCQASPFALPTAGMIIVRAQPYQNSVAFLIGDLRTPH